MCAAVQRRTAPRSRRQAAAPAGRGNFLNNFTGKITVGNTKDMRSSRIRFEAGARTVWHLHSAPQLLLVEEGRGRLQELASRSRDVPAGQPVLTKANVLHWHGAAPIRAAVQFSVFSGNARMEGPGHGRGVPRKRIDAPPIISSSRRTRRTAPRRSPSRRPRRSTEHRAPVVSEVPRAPPPKLPEITSQDLLDGLKHPTRWLTYSGDYSGRRHSPLKQITPENVSRLAAQWTFQAEGMPINRGFESTPLVMDGTLYITGNNNYAWAIDARTGRQIWRYRRALPPGLTYGGANPSNRGFAALGNLLYMATLDAHLLALDREHRPDRVGHGRWTTTSWATPRLPRRSSSRTR